MQVFLLSGKTMTSQNMQEASQNAERIANGICCDFIEHVDKDHHKDPRFNLKHAISAAILSAEARGRLAGNEECAKEFPMQEGPNIPWWLAEIVYKAYSRLYGDSQSLKRLAERGGFGWSEVKVIFDEYKKRFGSEEAQAIRQRQK